MKQQQIRAFTLVELIIVISILSLFATLAFVSFQSYVSESKNTQRLSSLIQIQKSIDASFITTGKYPLPDNPVAITLSGKTLSQQGTIGKNLSQMLQIQLNGEQKIYYSVSASQKGYQLLTPKYSTQQSFILKSYADSSDFHIVGNDVGYVFYADKSIPSTPTLELNTLGTNEVEVILGKNQIIQDLQTVKQILPNNTSCERLQSTGEISKSGWYTIESQNKQMRVYCEVGSENGGWTLLANIQGDSPIFGNRTTAGIWKTPIYNTGSEVLFPQKDYLSEAYGFLPTNEILLCYQNTNVCYNFQHNRNIPLFHFFRDNISHTEYVNNLVGYSNNGDIEKRNKFLNLLGISSGTHAGNCQFLGINYRRNNITETGLVIGLGGDNDGPCVSANNSTASTLDNFALGVGGYHWSYSHLGVNSNNPKYIPGGIQSFPIAKSNSVSIITSSTVAPQITYWSDNWIIYGK